MNKNRKRYTLQDSANAFLAIFLVQILFVIVFSMIVSAVSKNTGMTTDEILNSNLCMFMNLIFSELIFFIVYVLYNVATQKKGFARASRMHVPKDWKLILGVIGLAAIALFGFNRFIGLFDYLLENVFGIANNQSSLFIMDNFGMFLVGVLLLAGIPAIAEELVFRGIIFNGLREKYSARTAIILSAIMFTLMHMSIYKTAYQLVLGLMLGAIIYLTGSIFYSMIFHFVNNFLIVLINYICTNTGSTFFVYTDWSTMNVILAIGEAVLATVLLVVGVYLMSKYCKKKKDFDMDFKLERGDIENSDEETNFVGGTDVTGLSDYEIKQLNSSFFISARGWLIISFVLSAIMWLISSFGG